MTDIQNFQIIGIDCAADPADIGVAYARPDDDRLTVERVLFGERRPTGKATKNLDPAADRTKRLEGLANAIAAEIERAGGAALLALDAPLGWPTAMPLLLSRHLAGASLPREADAEALFQRRTDRFIVAETCKTPIEVGANLIARVTHTTLRLIGMLQSKLKNPPMEMADAPLRSYPAPTHGVNFIEVYPALAGPFFLNTGEGVRTRKYWKSLAVELKTKKKKVKNEDAGTWGNRMRQIADRLDVRIHQAAVNDTKSTKARRDHGLDAILCPWTGFRFLQGECSAPDEAKASPKITDDEVRREGWIWFDRRIVQTDGGETSGKSPGRV